MASDRQLRRMKGRDVKPPPDYRETRERYDNGDRKGPLKVNRKLRSTGEPRGKSNRRYEDNDTWGEWAPGEFQRSYPKNKKNAEWYRTHSYGKAYPGAEHDTWGPIQGPPTPKGRKKPKKGPADRPAASRAVANAAAVPKGYHRMPNGKLMKDSAHKKGKG